MVEHLDTDLRRVLEYNAEDARNDAESHRSTKVPTIKLGADQEPVGFTIHGSIFALFISYFVGEMLI